MADINDEELEITSAVTTGPRPTEPIDFDDSDNGDGSATSCPWSLTYEQQVHNLKENLERALGWVGVLFNFEQHFELNPLLERIVSQLRDDPCLDGYKKELEELILRHLALGPKMTSLDLTILMGDLKMVKEILGRGIVPDNVLCRHDTSSKENIYYTPLHLAVVGGNSHIVDALLEKGADVNALNWLSQTPLDLACKKGNVTMLQQLLAKDDEGKDPLHVAVQFGDINFIQSMPSLNVNAKDHKKETPLHLAIEGGNRHILDLLLEKGVDVNAQNLLNQTPLDLAYMKGNVTMLQQLLAKDRSSLWSLTYKEQVKNLKENWKRALYWTGAQIKLQNNFQAYAWFERVVAKLRVNPCLDSCELNIEQSLFGQFLLGATMNSLDLAILMGDLKMVQRILESNSILDNVICGPIQDLSTNQKFLQLTPIFDTPTKTGILYTPLHLAVEVGDSDIVDALLEKGGDVNALNWLGQTPLDLACKKGNVTMLRQLLAKDNEKKDPLHVAVQLGDIDFIQRLSSLNVDAMNYKKETPLHLAVEGGNRHIMDVLLENNADVNVQNSSNETPLHLARKKGNVTMLEQLLEENRTSIPWSLTYKQQVKNLKENWKRALYWTREQIKLQNNVEADSWFERVVAKLRVNPCLDSCELNIEQSLFGQFLSGAKMNSLDLAILMGDLKMVHKILESSSTPINVIRGPIQNRNTNKKVLQLTPIFYTRTKTDILYVPLHLAVEVGDSDIVDALLEKGNDVNALNWLGQTPLDLACKKGNVTMLKQLLTKDDKGKDPLHVAVRLGDINFIQSLPSLNVHAKNDKKETPLHLAVEGGDSHIVNVILDKGADVNAQNSSDETPLHLACKKGNVTMLKKLLEKDDEGKDPLHVAVQYGDINFIKKLSAPKVNAVDINQKTPLHYLATQFFPRSYVTDVVEYLANHKAFDMKALDSSGFSAFYRAILCCNTQFVLALLDSFKDQIQLNEECDKDLGPPIQIAMENGHEFSDIQRVLMECDRVKSYIEILYRDRQVYVDATNAILVGAALIASVTFAAWLQPPLNYTSYTGEGYSSSVPTPSSSDLNYVDVEHNIALRAFWVFNALSFYFAIGAVVCGARSVLPRSHLFIKKTVDKLRTNLLVTLTLLACSMLFVITAFAIAGTIVLTPLVKYQWCMIVPTIVGGMVCLISLVFLVKTMVENCFDNTCDNRDRLNFKKE